VKKTLRVLPGHWWPEEPVCLDSFYVGNLKGVGKVYQLTAIDVITRWATVAIVLGRVNGMHTVGLLDQVLKHYRRLGVGVRAVLTHNWREYVASGLRPLWPRRTSP
jgi:hypothetical protein